MRVRLTDGKELLPDVAERRVKDVDELDELNKAGCNLYWYAIDGLPRIPAKAGAQ